MSVAQATVAALLLSMANDGLRGHSEVATVPAAVQVMADARQRAHLDASSSLRDLLRHPAFAGFAPLILPWDDRDYDEAMPLGRISALLPYHTQVDIDAVASGLNQMIDDVADGKTVFYRIYDEAQRRQQVAKNHTGLFFFRGRPGAPFAVIAPGGGFAYVGSVHEGFPYAAAIRRQGYNAFVLKYRVGAGAALATEDLAAAVSFIFANAATLDVAISHYSLWGSSAGARMAAAIGSHGTARFGGADLAKPTTVVMAYTGHSDYASNEPSTFAIVGEEDAIAAPATMARRVEALRAAGTRVDFRRYPHVGHGFGLGIGTSAEGWIVDAIRFWETSMRQSAATGPKE